LNQVNSLVI